MHANGLKARPQNKVIYFAQGELLIAFLRLFLCKLYMNYTTEKQLKADKYSVLGKF